MEVVKVGARPGPRTRPLVNWSEVAKALRENPGEEVLFEEFRQTESLRSIVSTVNGLKCPKALRALGGTVKASMRNSRPLGASRRIGDVWIQWTPDQ